MKKRLKKASLFIFSSLLLTSCDASAVSEKIANAIPNLWITLAQLTAFLITCFIFFKFAYKPIKEKMAKRAETIEKNIKDAEIAKNDALRANEEAQSAIKDSQIVANKITDDATKAATLIAQQIKDDALKQAEAIKKQAEIDAIEKQKALEKKTHNQIVTTALEASKEILHRELTKEDNEAVIADFIDKMNNEDDK